MRNAHFGMLPLGAFEHCGDRKIKLHGPAKAVGNFVGDVVDTVGNVATNIVNGAVNDPLGTVAKIGTAIVAPAFLPLVSGIDTIAQGGNLSDALTSAGTSFVGGQVGGLAGPEIANATDSTLAGQLGGATIGGATTAALRGQDPLTGAIAGGVGSTINTGLNAGINNPTQIANVDYSQGDVNLSGGLPTQTVGYNLQSGEQQSGDVQPPVVVYANPPETIGTGGDIQTPLVDNGDGTSSIANADGSIDTYDNITGELINSQGGGTSSNTAYSPIDATSNILTDLATQQDSNTVGPVEGTQAGEGTSTADTGTSTEGTGTGTSGTGTTGTGTGASSGSGSGTGINIGLGGGGTGGLSYTSGSTAPLQQTYTGIANLTPGVTGGKGDVEVIGLPKFSTGGTSTYASGSYGIQDLNNPKASYDPFNAPSAGSLKAGITGGKGGVKLSGLPGYLIKAADGGSIPEGHNPQFYSEGGLSSMGNRYVKGDGDGTSDSVPAMLATGEFVIPADVVSNLGNGSNDAGAKILDEFMRVIRAHKQKHDAKRLPPDSKGPLAYLLQSKKQLGKK